MNSIFQKLPVCQKIIHEGTYKKGIERTLNWCATWPFFIWYSDILFVLSVRFFHIMYWNWSFQIKSLYVMRKDVTITLLWMDPGVEHPQLSISTPMSLFILLYDIYKTIYYNGKRRTLKYSFQFQNYYNAFNFWNFQKFSPLKLGWDRYVLCYFSYV